MLVPSGQAGAAQGNRREGTGHSYGYFHGAPSVARFYDRDLDDETAPLAAENQSHPGSAPRQQEGHIPFKPKS